MYESKLNLKTRFLAKERISSKKYWRNENAVAGKVHYPNIVKQKEYIVYDQTE